MECCATGKSTTTSFDIPTGLVNHWIFKLVISDYTKPASKAFRTSDVDCEGCFCHQHHNSSWQDKGQNTLITSHTDLCHAKKCMKQINPAIHPSNKKDRQFLISASKSLKVLARLHLQTIPDLKKILYISSFPTCFMFTDSHCICSSPTTRNHKFRLWCLCVCACWQWCWLISAGAWIFTAVFWSIEEFGFATSRYTSRCIIV